MAHPARVASLSLVGLFATSLSCSSSQPPPSHEAVAHIGQSIMGGVSDPDDTAVAAIVSSQTGGLCTGTLIAPNLILTAHHCVSASAEQINCATAKFGTTYSAGSFYVTFAEDAMSGGMSSFKKAAEIYLPPGGNLVCGYDVAMIRLVENVSSTVAVPLTPRVDAPVVVGEEYKAVGYGNTNDTSGAGRRRMRDGLKVSCVAESCNNWYMDTDREWEGETGICQGDSGGPALDSAGRVVGVVSRGQEGCDSPVYGSVHAWGDWIKQIAAEAAQKGNYDPAAWVTGGSTEPPEAGVEAGADTGAVGPGSAGTPCASGDDCTSGACVFENDVTYYCSEWCTDDAGCPQGWYCDIGQGACFQHGAFGESCSSPEDCRSSLCVSNDNATWYCSLGCDEQKPCPGGATCSPDTGSCFKVEPAAAEVGSGSTSGCSTSGGAGASGHAPWYLALAIVALRRRRNRAR